jgi:signal transduction histidine kinase
MKLNCWEYNKCRRGSSSKDPCSAAVDKTSNGVNHGKNAGRICWTLPDTPCFNRPMGRFDEKRNICLSCEFFLLVKKEEGILFQFFKVAQGVSKSRDLHNTIAKMEHLFIIHDRLHSQFDLKKTIKVITDEARGITGAQRSLVLLMKGDPPSLHGDFPLRGKDQKVAIPLDEKSAVGYAAVHDEIVNVRDLYNNSGALQGVFNRTFDSQLSCKTQSFIAVPVQSSDRRVIGVITAANAKKGYFSADDEWFMRTYAIEVALAVEKQKFLQQSFSVVRLASIGETVAGLSHCIKNIAHALRGSSYIIKRAIDSGSVRDIKAAWEILDRHIESLANLSLDVLSYQPEAAEDAEGNNLNDIVRHVINLYKEEARARAITLKTNLGKDVDPCSINSRGIYRILVNLITNAFDACPFSKGVVVVGTKRVDESTLILTVSDNGRGMDETTRAEIFDLFKTTKPGIGTGLGLPTVASIAKEHNGEIKIDTKLEKGTTFRIYIKELS